MARQESKSRPPALQPDAQPSDPPFSSPEPLVLRLKNDRFSDHVTKRNGGSGDQNGDPTVGRLKLKFLNKVV